MAWVPPREPGRLLDSGRRGHAQRSGRTVLEVDGPVEIAAFVAGDGVRGFFGPDLRADRASAYEGWSRGIDEALKQEARRGAPVVAKEGRDGAARFAGGKGRGGDFNSI